MRINIRNRFVVSAFLMALSLLAFPAILGLSGCDEDKGRVVIDPPITVFSRDCPAWSPDGQWIAIAKGLGELWIPCGIYLVRPDGSDLHLVFSPGPRIDMLDVCWSPDGEWFGFNTCREIFKIRTNGDSFVRLTFSGENYTCTWSYSDTLIAFQHSFGEYNGVWLMNSDGGDQRPFLINGAGHTDFTVGDSLFYIIGISGDSGQMSFSNVSDLGVKTFHKWKHGAPYTSYYDPEVSPDGKEVASSVNGQIRKISTGGGNLRTLTVNGGDHLDWSPDGQHIVYCEPSDNPHGGVIRIMNSDGTDNHIIVDWSQFRPDSLGAQP
jgi:Tol biopolymer transport system component